MAQQQNETPYTVHSSDDSDDDDDDDEKAELFSPVIAALDKDKLSLLALAVLQRTSPLASQPSDVKPSISEPIYGSYHVVFPLTFDNGLRWAVKIPVNGIESKWDDLSARALASEANTMRLLKRDTTIPLPDVLEFSSTTDNSIGCPYILMTYISGTPLYNVWFGHHLNNISPDVIRARRVRALEGIASAMEQLDRFTFQTGGCPVFNDNEKQPTIGPLRRVDHKAILERWFIHHDPSDDPIYVESAAYSDPKLRYTFMLDRHPEKNPIPQGLAMLLHQLISWIPEPQGKDPFVLAHPDFDIQNFIVSEEGELLGVIDWDGVAAVPHSFGNRSYPGWLTRDWDPAMYGYKESMEDGVEPEGVWEDSPDSLAYYRGIYNAIMARRDCEINLCRMSLITENLAIAAENPPQRNPILEKLVGEAWVAAGQEKELDYLDVARSFSDGEVNGEVMDKLKKGFHILLSKEGL
ncbi:hypothetical protein PISL3812_09646 [Talaromyces islandicus]|uniref:Aminoglycoside phosphotransferase domain-containing protein n=1 Tax=Talaromyces islandicus TaxID=28573 RepID=A0A0U1MAA0_TALIS|nr:hypothetical protein PISL3812_09646 [Talaromyces islandicus]